MWCAQTNKHQFSSDHVDTCVPVKVRDVSVYFLLGPGGQMQQVKNECCLIGKLQIFIGNSFCEANEQAVILNENN